MPDKENEPSSTNAPAPEAPATEAPAIDAPPTDAPAVNATPTGAPAIDMTPAGASATEATDAAPKPKKKSKKQRKQERRAINLAARPTPIPTPENAIVAIQPGSKMRDAGLVCRVEIDNSNKTKGDKKGYIYIVDSTGEKKWVRPGCVVDASAYKDKFEDEEKKSGGKPYMLGGDDDASESKDEPLEKPPVAKDAEIETLGTTRLRELYQYIDGPRGQKAREERARNSAALLADVSEEKADERAALVKSLGETLKDAWTIYEDHRKKHPELYSEEEAEEEEEDYSGVPIDHVKLNKSVKDKHKKLIQKCVAKRVDLSSIEGMPPSEIRKSDFTKAIADAEGITRDQQQSQRLAGKEAPPLPTTSNAGQSVVYMDSVNADLIGDTMVADAQVLRDQGTLVPVVGVGGCAARGGFFRGVGTGSAFRLVGVGGPGFHQQFDYYAVYESDPVGAMSSSLRIELEFCYESSEWDELRPRLVYAAEIALESLPDEASVKDRAKAVYEAYYWEVEKHEHEAVWKSTFKAPGLFTQVERARRDRRRRRRPKGALRVAGPTVSGLQ